MAEMYMANPNIHYDLNLIEENTDLNEFVRVIKDLRTVRRMRIREVGMELEDIDLVNIDLKYQLRTIRLKMRVDRFNLIGYVKSDCDILWELRADGDFQYLAGSYPTGVSVSLGPNSSQRNIGWMAMIDAFNMLWLNDPNGIEAAIQTITLMLCETAKFHWSFLEVYGNMERKLSSKVPGWMPILTNQWENISMVATLSLPRGMKFPEDLESDDWEMYNTRNLKVFDPETTPAAPYFARCVIRVPHIIGS